MVIKAIFPLPNFMLYSASNALPKTKPKQKIQQYKIQPLSGSYFCSGAETQVPQADSKMF